MKVELHGAGRGAPVTLMTDDALLEFRTEAEVRSVLRAFMHDPGNLHALREVLAAEGGGYSVASMSDAQVIERIAPIVARSCVGIIRTELLPVRPADFTGAADAFENPEPLFDSLLDAENEVEDPLPVPVLPPVFPVVAADEASTILGENRLYKLVLDMLRYVGLASEGESEVAKEYTAEASQTTEAVTVVTDTFIAEIDPLAAEANLGQAPSETALMLQRINGEQRLVMEQEADGAAESLGSALEGDRDLPAPSEVAPTVQSEGERQAGRVIDATDTAIVEMDLLLQGDGNDPAPSTLGQTFRDNSARQGESITAAADGQTDTLNGLAQPAQPGDAPPESSVAEAINAANGGRGDRLGGTVVDAVGGLTDLLGRPTADVRALSAPGWSLQPEPYAGARLGAIPPTGAYMVAQSDGSQMLSFTVRTQQDDGGGRELATIQPVIDDGLAVAHWAPETLPTDPVYFEASTEDGLVRIASAPVKVDNEAATVDNLTDDDDVPDGAVRAAGWMLTPGDPQNGVLDSAAVGPVFFGVRLGEPGLVKLQVLDAEQGADADGNPPKPLTRFSVPTDDRGLLVVPYNLTRLPAGVGTLRVEVRVGRDPDLLFESVVPVVRRLAFGDARIVVDASVPAL